MSDNSDETVIEGPLMFCATRVMNPGPAKIGRLSDGVNLARTIVISTAIWTAGGAAAVGLPVLMITNNLMYSVVGFILGAVIGKFLDHWSPLRGERILTWAGLSLSTRADSIKVDGQRARVYIGTAMVSRQPAGRMQTVLRCAEVVPGSTDNAFKPLSDDKTHATLPWPQATEVPC